VQHGVLPEGLALQRTTDEFDSDSVPVGLLRAHRLAAGVWGLLTVNAGSLAFVWEDQRDEPITLVAGDSLVIEPEAPHHVEPGPDARFTVAFHR
jgi:tellurite resistance-related uncharacterized protein